MGRAIGDDGARVLSKSLGVSGLHVDGPEDTRRLFRPACPDRHDVGVGRQRDRGDVPRLGDLLEVMQGNFDELRSDEESKGGQQGVARVCNGYSAMTPTRYSPGSTPLDDW